eukprot:1240-Heterococcus_DN1.PRE.2
MPAAWSAAVMWIRQLSLVYTSPLLVLALLQLLQAMLNHTQASYLITEAVTIAVYHQQLRRQRSSESSMQHSIRMCTAILTSNAVQLCMPTHMYILTNTLQDIDELLNRGEERTEELKEKIEKVVQIPL